MSTQESDRIPKSATGVNHSVSYGYDNLGEQTSMVDQNGTAHAYTYDSLGRKTLDSVTTLGSGVDGSVLALGYTYNTQGLPYQQTSYSNAAGTTVVNQDQDVYNGFGQLIGEYQSVSGAVNTSTTPEVQYAYSSAASGSNPTEMIYPNGRILHMGYDNNALDTAIGRVDYLADDNGSGGVGSHLADYTYLGLSGILSQADGNGVTLTTTLDQFGRVEEMNWLNTSTSTSTDAFKYGYDQDSNVLYKSNGVNASFSELYTYDSLNRLTSFQRGTLSSDNTTITTANTLPGSSQSWSLDAVGNQTATTTDSTPTDKTQNSKNQLTGVGSATLTYDNNGNTTTDENGNTLTYNAWNQLVTDSAGTTSYSFDANGRRITETHAGTTTDLYFTTQGQVIEERVAGTVTAQNVFSIDFVNDLLLRDDNSVSGNLGISGSGLGNRVYYQHDANFNVTATIDNGGNVINRYVYTPYGVQTVLTGAWATSSASNSIYGDQGGRMDLFTGLIRFGVRDYNPSNAIWIQPDPKVYVNGMNDYQFEIGSPVNKLDPAGTEVDNPIEGAVPQTLTHEGLDYELDSKLPGVPGQTLISTTEEQTGKPWSKDSSYTGGVIYTFMRYAWVISPDSPTALSVPNRPDSGSWTYEESTKVEIELEAKGEVKGVELSGKITWSSEKKFEQTQNYQFPCSSKYEYLAVPIVKAVFTQTMLFYGKILNPNFSGNLVPSPLPPLISGYTLKGYTKDTQYVLYRRAISS